MVPLKTGKLDQMLLITVLVLEISGLVILYSASAYNGRVRFSDAGYYLKKQLFAAVLGFGCMWLIFIKWRSLRPWPIYCPWRFQGQFCL